MGTATSSQDTELGLIVSETWVPTFEFSCCCCFCLFWIVDLPPVSLEAASEQRPSLSGPCPRAYHQACVWHIGYVQSMFEWKNGWTDFLPEGMSGHLAQAENFPRTFLIALCEKPLFTFVIKLQGELQQSILGPQCPPGPVGERRLAWYEASWTGRWKRVLASAAPKFINTPLSSNKIQKVPILDEWASVTGNQGNLIIQVRSKKICFRCHVLRIFFSLLKVVSTFFKSVVC